MILEIISSFLIGYLLGMWITTKIADNLIKNEGKRK
jgi:uncharacterized protein YneF (UPF0154 family)